MNSTWNKNINAFINRFPALAKMYGYIKENQCIHSEHVVSYQVVECKNGQIGAKENGRLLHSLYNPQKEANTLVTSKRKKDDDTGVFLGTGLGWSAIEYATLFPDDNLFIIESNPEYFFTAMLYIDWTPVFKIKKCIIALNAPFESIIHLIEQYTTFSHCAIFSNPVHQMRNQDYYKNLETLIKRNIQKENINTSTLHKFSRLWLKNSCRNIKYLAQCDGIKRFNGKAPENLCAVILAAGPTLQEVLPYLNEIKKRCILIAVDTALRACLNAGTEPDFVVLVDPQYYASRHIMGLSSPSSILITESAAYPCVYRFNCREIIMCSSLFPLGQYVESKLGNKGHIEAGGSVSTTAWDFANRSGFKEIIFAGLDLGYPDFETHIRGSTFEEKIHTVSDRLHSGETKNIEGLYGAPNIKGEDYNGNTILTDSKMKLFAWWFESKSVSSDVHTKVFSARSLKIPGFSVASPEEFLKRNECISLRNEFLSSPSLIDRAEKQKQFMSVIDELKDGFNTLYELASKGIKTADAAQKKLHSDITPYIQTLQSVDNAILNSTLKDAAALIFPQQKELDSLFSQINENEDKTFIMLQHSKIIYEQLQKSIKEYNFFLSKL